MGKTLSIVAFILSFIIPLVGLILGIVALSQAKKDKDALKGLAIAAIVIGGVLTLLAIIIIVFVAGMWIVLLGGSDPETFIGEKFSLSAPLIAEAYAFDAEFDAIIFQIRNGAGEKITIKKVQVERCSNQPLIVTTPYAEIEPDELGSVLFNWDEDCVKTKELFSSNVIFTYVTDSNVLEKEVRGYISGTPKDLTREEVDAQFTQLIP